MKWLFCKIGLIKEIVGLKPHHMALERASTSAFDRMTSCSKRLGRAGVIAPTLRG